MIRLYDTLQGSVRPLAQRHAGQVSLYACGPTVYDYPHLGHARQAMTYDILRRYLEWRGLEVIHVANVTDIDDKIIERAQSEGLSEPEVAARWGAVYAESMAALGILEPHHQPHATEFVGQMVALVETLVANDSAYATDSGVYLRVHRVPGYGDLVGRSLHELASGAGARVEVDAAKEDPLDFALWKAAKPGEPAWASPWGDGRPGWHIECAAMSLGILGDGFDLHGGGSDLVFPHHTNERAEAIAAGRDFARHWMHNAMVDVDGEKMSKSLGNYTTVGALLDEHPLNARALRLLILQSHYRRTMEVNAEAMAQARAALSRLDAMVRKAAGAGVAAERPDPCAAPGGSASGDAGTGASGSGDARSLDRDAVAEFVAAMDDDLGTPAAMATVFATARRANAALDAGSDDAAGLVATVIELAGALGLRLGSPDGDASGSADADDTAEIEALVEARGQARAAKDFAEADRLRDALTAIGVTVEDTPTGPLWHRR